MEQNISLFSLQWLLFDLIKILPPEKLMENQQKIRLMFEAFASKYGQSTLDDDFITAFFGTMKLINDAGGFRQFYAFLLEAEKNGMLKIVGTFEPKELNPTPLIQ